MIPGEMHIEPGEIELNVGCSTITISVANTGDRPIQIGSHYHFYETNAALAFEREAARAWFVELWHLLRPALMGREAQPPRIWST